MKRNECQIGMVGWIGKKSKAKKKIKWIQQCQPAAVVAINIGRMNEWMNDDYDEDQRSNTPYYYDEFWQSDLFCFAVCVYVFNGWKQRP